MFKIWIFYFSVQLLKEWIEGDQYNLDNTDLFAQRWHLVVIVATIAVGTPALAHHWQNIRSVDYSWPYIQVGYTTLAQQWLDGGNLPAVWQILWLGIYNIGPTLAIRWHFYLKCGVYCGWICEIGPMLAGCRCFTSGFSWVYDIGTALARCTIGPLLLCWVKNMLR